MRWTWLAMVVVLLIAGGFMAGPAAAREKTDAAVPDVSDETLSDLISVLEDENQRQQFVDRLKALERIRAEEQAEARPKRSGASALIDRFFGELDRIWTGIRDGVRGLYRLGATAGRWRSVWTERLADPESRADWTRLALGLAAALIAALIVRLMLFKPAAAQPAQRPGLIRRIGLSLGALVLRLCPYVALLAVFSVAAEIAAVDQGPRDALFLILAAVSGYGALLALGRFFIDPGAPNRRVLSVADLDGRNLWGWWKKIAGYGLFYFLVTRLGTMWGLDPAAIDLVRGSLLLIFGAMVSLLVVRAHRYFKKRFDQAPSDEAGDRSEARERLRRVSAAAVRYWWIPALGYLWAVVILAWGRYENALGYIGTATAATLLFLAAFGVAAHVIGWALARLDRAADGLREYHPAAEGFVRRSLSWLRLGLHALIWPVVLLGAAQAWGLPVLSIARSPLGRNLLGRTAVIVVTALVVFALIRISRGVADRLLYTGQDREPGPKRQTFVPLVRTTVLVIAVFSALIIILRQLGVDVGPILAGAGIISLGVGLGAQSLVKDVINGLFILLQDLVSVGDVADVGGKSGVVESVGLRTVRLRDLSGNVHTVPNSSIDTVTNMTKGYSRYVLDVGVAYREDVDQVMAVLTEIGEEMRTDETYGPDILEPLEIFGVNELGDSAVVVRARVTTKPIKQWGVGREFLRRIKIAFDQRGIEIPFPHQTVYMGQPKQGPAPPLEVRLKRADGET